MAKQVGPNAGSIAARELVLRRIIFVTAAVVPLLRWASAGDAFSLAKFLVILAAGGAVAGAAASGNRFRELVRARPSSPYAWVVVSLLAVLVVSAVAADSWLGSLLGPYRRWNGLLIHLASASLALVVASVFRPIDVRLLLRIQAGTAVVAAVHGLLQWAGWVDPDLQATGSTVVANLGNANFVAAYLAVSIPTLLAEIVGARAVRSRLVVGAALGIVIVTIPLTRAIQGPVVALGAVGVGVVVWTWGRRRSIAWGVMAVGLLGGVATVVGLVGAGPLASLAAERSLELRGYYWQAALRMFADRPLLGVGPGRYVAYFRDARTEAAALDMPSGLEVDGAHNVFLDTLAGGGILAGVAMIAIVVVIVLAIARLLRRGAVSLVEAAAVGVWGGWFIQALVSVETPVLVLLGWLSGAAVVALAKLPSPDVASSGSGRKKKQPGRRSKRVAIGWREARGAVFGAVPVTVVALLWMSADIGAARSLVASRQGAEEAAEDAVERAVAVAPWVPRYRVTLGDVHRAHQNGGEAVSAYESALRIDARQTAAWVGKALAHRSVGKYREAVATWREVFVLEPYHPDVYMEAITDALAAEDPVALTWADQLVLVAPEDAQAWAQLGRATAQFGDRLDAIRALERALALGSDDPELLSLLEQLTG